MQGLGQLVGQGQAGQINGMNGMLAQLQALNQVNQGGLMIGQGLPLSLALQANGLGITGAIPDALAHALQGPSITQQLLSLQAASVGGLPNGLTGLLPPELLLQQLNSGLGLPSAGIAPQGGPGGMQGLSPGGNISPLSSGQQPGGGAQITPAPASAAPTPATTGGKAAGGYGGGAGAGTGIELLPQRSGSHAGHSSGTEDGPDLGSGSMAMGGAGGGVGAGGQGGGGGANANGNGNGNGGVVAGGVELLPSELAAMPRLRTWTRSAAARGVCQVDGCNEDLLSLRDYHQR